MNVTFKPARRSNVPLLIGLEGASGSGKTYSALLLATGIADEIGRAQGRKGRVYGIDTEHDRMLHYAPAPGEAADPAKGTFDFEHASIEPPFRPKTYGDAIDAAEAAGADVIVIDSFSHEWEGEGGVKDWAQEILDASPRMKAPAQWNIPKAGPDGHKRLVNKMLASRAHIIVCLRSEEKLHMEEVPELNADGSPKMWNGRPVKKTVITAPKDLPVKDRWQPICEKRFPYEITTSLLFVPTQPGVPIPRKLQEQHVPFVPTDRRIGRDTGAALVRWSMGGAAAHPSPPQGDGGTGESFQTTLARLKQAAARGTPALQDAWRDRRTGPHRADMESDGTLHDLKALAAAIDPQEPSDERQPQSAGYDGA